MIRELLDNKNHPNHSSKLTSLCTITDIPTPNSTIHLNIHFISILLSQLGNFLQAFRHEFLTTSTWVNGHDEEEIG